MRWRWFKVNTGFAVLRQHIPVLVGTEIVYGGWAEPAAAGGTSAFRSITLDWPANPLRIDQ